MRPHIPHAVSPPGHLGLNSHRLSDGSPCSCGSGASRPTQEREQHIRRVHNVGSKLAIVHSLGPTENLKVFVPLPRRHFSSRLFATVLKNGSTTMFQRVNPTYGEPGSEFAQRSEQLRQASVLPKIDFRSDVER